MPGSNWWREKRTRSPAKFASNPIAIFAISKRASSSAIVVPPGSEARHPFRRAAFTIEDANGRPKTFQIVGEDEARTDPNFISLVRAARVRDARRESGRQRHVGKSRRRGSRQDHFRRISAQGMMSENNR